MKKGKFIVIDGTDGSGKATQVGILEERLKKEGYDVVVVDFPQYGNPSAFFVEKYLNGAYGSAEEVGAKRGSLFYALDRYDAKTQMEKYLQEGKIVLANRYVSASMGHQGGKINDENKRAEFLKWLYELEYEVLGIPKPDANIILHVSAKIGQELVDKKGHRDYVGGEKRDIHEADIEHLKMAEQSYLWIVDNYPEFSLIECVKDDQIMTREDIHDLIWAKVKDLV
jgi:dTMP kinase